jgi:hypothetical protein
MESQTTARFWTAYYKLPSSVQKTAKKIHQRWQDNPYDPSLKFREINNDNLCILKWLALFFKKLRWAKPTQFN